jgi:hypothetical protein
MLKVWSSPQHLTPVADACAWLSQAVVLAILLALPNCAPIACYSIYTVVWLVCTILIGIGKSAGKSQQGIVLCTAHVFHPEVQKRTTKPSMAALKMPQSI